MFGGILGLWAIKEKTTLTGTAILLILVKPHIGWLLSIAYFFWYRNWKMMFAIAIVFLLSLFIWGLYWPLDWIDNLYHASVNSRIIQEANIGLFPYGLLSWLGLFILMPKKGKSLYIASATITSLPMWAPIH